MKQIIISTIIFLFIISCDSTDTTKDINQESTKQHSIDTLVPTLPTDSIEFTPSLIYFEQNDCKENNEKGEKIIVKKLYSDTLSIKITSVQDCGTKYGGNFKLSGDTLDLIIKQLPRIVKHKNGKTDTIYESQECYCLYKFSFKINHIVALPKTIMLNGSKFRGVWKGL
jgi:hypothetical protein